MSYEVVYWICFILLLFTFLGYPLLMLILGGQKKRVEYAGSYQPRVSLLICAYNEEDVIAEKIENALAIDYPSDKLEIVVVSDGSTDRTNDIVKEIVDPRLNFISYPERGGKAKALNTGMEHIIGEVVIFTDANVMFEPEALYKLVNVFKDNSIGCAVGNVQLKSADGSIAGEGLYSKYEKAVHTAEGNFSSMITVDGAMYALRREYVKPIPPDSLTDDWYLATGVLEDDLRIVYVDDAIGYENAAETVSGEFTRKVRMIAGGYQTAFRRSKLFFNPSAHPLTFFMFISHKFLRWLALFFMAGLYLSNLYLLGELSWYMMTFILQVVFYVLALLGWLSGDKLKSPLFHIPYYFTAVNWAAVLGLIKYISGEQKVTWDRGRT
ncbi:MAG: glycosyltransferase family 2 protein [candidate division Zixibacteria bacterium]|nr:glycosyltransferase family 2 protein [candidate division Zixibacteria bacterium]